MKSTQNNWQDDYASFEEAKHILTDGYGDEDVAIIDRALHFLWNLPERNPDYLPDPVSVAARLKSLGVDAETVVATLLGSFLVAGHLSVDDVRSAYGNEIGRLVENVRWLNSLIVSNYPTAAAPGAFASQQTETLRRMVLSIVDDARAVLIRLAFRAQRMPLLGMLPEEERRHFARETLELYAPLANRLGVAQLKWEMEDLAFRILEPDAYKRVAKALEERREDRETYIQNFVSILKGKLHDLNVQGAKVYGRRKHIYSIWLKM